MSTESMSGRERVLAAVRGEDVDRIPWSPCLDGYFLGKVDQVEGFRRLGANDAVPKNTTWEKLEAVGEAAREAGKFPLGG